LLARSRSSRGPSRDEDESYARSDVADSAIGTITPRRYGNFRTSKEDSVQESSTAPWTQQRREPRSAACPPDAEDIRTPRRRKTRPEPDSPRKRKREAERAAAQSHLRESSRRGNATDFESKDDLATRLKKVGFVCLRRRTNGNCS
jgi:hypothetical protein